MDDLSTACQILASHELVAIPTETVYGLAGSIASDVALKKIFTAKERPFFDPLIIHVSDLNTAKNLVSNWPPAAEPLAKSFWPGPLTLVLDKNPLVSDLISAGLNTVGIRIPDHPLTLVLLEKSGPLAAPSANKFGRTSPTTAQHVRESFAQDNIYILDGGPCHIGLESTVLRIEQSSSKCILSILRPGQITERKIKEALLSAGFRENRDFIFKEIENKKMAPGQMKHHYMPEKPLVIIQDQVPIERLLSEVSLRLESSPDCIDDVKIIKPKQLQSWKELFLSQDPTIASREFYAKLRDLSKDSCDLIFFYKKNFHSGKDWEALFDRMNKAASIIL